MTEHKRRVLVIGLDCAEPSLVFGKWRNHLLNLNRLMEQGAYGRLRSCDPPITVPAWASMLSSNDPGQLGFYGFRNRADHSYDKLRIANSMAVQVPRVWNVLSENGKKSVVVGVPQTYPVEPLDGCLVSDFLTPPNAPLWTHPAHLADEINDLLEGQQYEFDATGFRTENKAGLLEQIYRVTKKRWRVINHLIENKEWDLFLFVEMGTDRIHHGFWSNMDAEHYRYEPGNPFETAIFDYYKYIDGEIGHLLEKVDDDTIVMVVSDHGAQRMDGGFCVNEWLKQRGFLKLHSQPEGQVKLSDCDVDWSATKAWGDGGYYARIFMNVKGREPEGIIEPENYEAERDLLKAELEATVGPDGCLLGTVALKPQDIYREVNGIAPDLIVYFGDLYWRSVGSLGHDSIYTFTNDTGPDDANHAYHGLVIVNAPQVPLGGRELFGLQLECIAPTLLQWLGVEIPPQMKGTPLDVFSQSELGAAETGYSKEEEAAIADHLGALGYL